MEFYGLRNADIRGKTLSEAAEMTSIDLNPAVHAEHERQVMAEDRAIQLEWRVVREGREHVFADVKFPVRDGSGSVVAIAGIEVDVTDRERHEAELADLLQSVEMARDAAEEATDAKSRFLASMSHELRTPLNAIIGFTRIVRRNSEEVLDRRQTDNLDKILLSARQLLSLINDILDLSRVEAGELRVEPRTVDVAALVRECVASVEPLVPTGVELLTRVDGGLDEFSTDPDTLRQILVNLLSNAVKYTEAGSISVSARLDGESLVADVTDTGIGIAAEDLERIFEEFHQAEQATRHREAGRASGCRSPGAWPARSTGRSVSRAGWAGLDVHAAAARVAGCGDGSHGGDDVKTILIVEDVELNRDLLVQLLEDEYRLVTAENGEAAVATARAERPDLILMDLALPKLDGWEAVRAIRREPANAGVTIIGVSSYAMPGDPERALEAGCDDYLTKPIDEQQLFEKLRLHLGDDD